jgi:hypothetical protein
MKSGNNMKYIGRLGLFNAGAKHTYITPSTDFNTVDADTYYALPVPVTQKREDEGIYKETLATQDYVKNNYIANTDTKGGITISAPTTGDSKTITLSAYTSITLTSNGPIKLSGKVVLNTSTYGKATPSSGQTGQIFFQYV